MYSYSYRAGRKGDKNPKISNESKFEDNCILNEALWRSLLAMLTTVHSKIKETPFERHYGRKPRTELINYLNVPTDNYKHISV